MLTRLLRLLAPLAPRRHPRSFPILRRGRFQTSLFRSQRRPTPAPRPTTRPLQRRPATPAQPQSQSPTRPKNPAQAISRQPAPSGGGLARDSSPFTPHPNPAARHPPANQSNPPNHPPSPHHPAPRPRRCARSCSLAPWERVGVRVFRAPNSRPPMPLAAPMPRACATLPRPPVHDADYRRIPHPGPPVAAPALARPRTSQKTAPPHLKSFLEKLLRAQSHPIPHPSSAHDLK